MISVAGIGCVCGKRGPHNHNEEFMPIDFWTMLAINAGIGAIITSVKNPASAAVLKEQLGHLVEAICAAYGWTVTRP